MQPVNPLQKYFRQPKIYISLPSKGLYYPAEAFQGDSSNVPVFGMNGIDEILYRTPDALFTGEATAKVIESCCPYIKDGFSVPTLDLDVLVIAIRIATYGEVYSTAQTCKNCETENDYDIDLRKLLEHFNQVSYNNKVTVDHLTITLRPLNYKELTEFNIENFKLQKLLMNLDGITDEIERQKVYDELYKGLADLQINLLMKCIENIQIPEGTINEKQWIDEWLKNTDKTFFAQLKEKIDENKKNWTLPPQSVKCQNCGTVDNLYINLDQSDFFANS